MKLCPTCPHKDRSPEEHRTLFGAIGKAFDNWPERHVFHPTSADHLRHWLLIEADWYETIEVPADMLDSIKPVLLFALGGPHARFGRCGNAVVIFKAKSIAKDKCGKRDFQDISSKIDAILRINTGFGIEEYVAEAKRSAA